MNTDKFTFKLTFKGDGTSFSATTEAEKWLRERGFSIGSMCMGEPRGLLREQGVWIHKWRNLSSADKELLDGVITSDNHRDGEVTVNLNKNPDEK